MDYETGISSSPADLVSKLATFAATNGWTINTPSSGYVFVKGDIVVGISSSETRISLRGAIAYNAGAAWDAQTGNSGFTTGLTVGAGPFTAYHFFAGAEDGKEYLNAAIEYAAGRYRHLAFGTLLKHGTYTGGTYVDSTDWNTSTSWQNQPDESRHQVICDANSNTNQGGPGAGQVWCDYDSKSNNWVRIGLTNTFNADRGIGSVRSNGINQMFPWLGYARWNLRNLTAPLIYFANRPSNLRSPIGRIPNMRLVGMQNLEPGVTLSIGGSDWLVLPIIQRTESYDSGNSTIESSGIYGYAYKLP